MPGMRFLADGRRIRGGDRCAVKRGLIRSAYVAEVIHEQVRIANESGWPLPDGITNESVEREILGLLRSLEESSSAL